MTVHPRFHGRIFLAFTVAVFAVTLPIRGQDPAGRPSGYWALVDVTENATPDDEVLELYPAQIKGRRGEMHSINTAYESAGGRARWSQEARWTWSDAPQALSEGQALTVRLTCEKLHDTGGPDRADNGSLLVDIANFEQMPGTRGVVRFAAVNDPDRFFLNLRDEGKVALDFVGQVPGVALGSKRPGAEGDWISLRVVVSHGRHHAFFYNYHWVAGTPPPVPPPTRTGGDTTIGGSGGTGTGTTGGVPAGEPANVTRMTLQAGRREVEAGGTVVVPIYLLRAHDIANLNVVMTYDASVAKTTGAFAKGNLLDRSLFELNPQESGILRVGFAQNSDLSGDGTVAHITFVAAGAAGSKTTLHLEVTTISSASGAKPDIATIDGEIIVAQKRTPGDSDGDGNVTARDAGEALKMSVRLIPINMICDVDHDGIVTSTDARLILAQVVGKR